MSFFFFYQLRVNALQIQKKFALIIYLVIITTIFQAVEGEIEDEKVNIVVIPNTHKMKKTRKRPMSKLNVLFKKYAFCSILLCFG